MKSGLPSAVSLRKLLITRVGLLVAVSMLLVSAGFVVLGLLPMARHVAESQFDTARVKVQSGLDAVFLPPDRLLRLSQRWLAGKAPDLVSPQVFNQWFQPVLENFDAITSVVGGTSSGQGWLLLQQVDGSWRNRMTDLPRWGNQHQLIERMPGGETRTHWSDQTYDPRLRPWYRAAMTTAKSGQVAWTDPYTFFTTGDPGISAAMRMPLNDGQEMVLGFDLKLRDLSSSTSQATVGRNGMALVVTDDGRVMALPARPASQTQADWLKHILKPAAELGLAPVTEALKVWNESGRSSHDVLAYNTQGVGWLASIRPYSLGHQHLWVVTLAPESDFSPAWLPMLSALGGSLFVLLGLVMLITRSQTERLTQPLEQLAQSSEKIGQLNFDPTPPVHSHVAEIQQLARAQQAMLEMLRGNQTTLAGQADQLREQIAVQQRTEDQMRRQNEVLSALITHFPGGISMVDADLKVRVYNEQFKRLQDLPEFLFQGDELHFEDIIRHNIQRGDYGPGDPQQHFEARMALAKSPKPYRFERWFPNGKVLEIRGTPLPGGGFVSGYNDITEYKQTQEKLQLAASVFTSTSEAITITDSAGCIIDVNDAFTRITGYERAEVLGRNPRLLSSGLQGPEFYGHMWQELIDKGHWHGEIWNRRKNGEVFAEMLTINAVHGAAGGVLRYVALFSDITALKQHQAQLEHIAHFDALTNLPNRVLLADRLQQGLAQAQRHGHLLAVAYLDLDGFKVINDTHGHDVGDQLLIALANLMRQALREGDTLARLGGDEFVAVLLDLPEVNASEPLLTRLLAAAARPIEVDGLTLQVSASLGVTFFPQMNEVDADQLMRQADHAMYQAKLAGRNRYCVFDADQDSSVRGHHESLERLRLALAQREFVLYYQPKVNMRTGQVVGAEALIRWQHPQRGLLAPATFLPIIEDHPLAIEVGEWVIGEALHQMGQWLAQGLDLPVSVNIGARQLQHPGFLARLGELLAAHPLVSPACLELEVLETSALEDMVGVSRVIEACQALGVTFALDDFGTGYSSLTYLKRLPVAMLKIDQSFVRDMLDDPEDLAILHGVIGLANAFRREVIAEGVETVAHGTMLLQLGCELAQGYGIARPMPAAQVPHWCHTWQPDVSWVSQTPVAREMLPLLFARADLRAWLLSLEAYLKGELPSPPPMDCHHCQLGRWIDHEGRSRYGTLPVFTRMQGVHHQVHDLAALMLTQRETPDEAMAHLPELHALRDALQDQLSLLMKALTS